MKPHRVRMAHNLIVNYNLYKEMDVFRPPLVGHADLTRFHTDAQWFLTADEASTLWRGALAAPRPP